MMGKELRVGDVMHGPEDVLVVSPLNTLREVVEGLAKENGNGSQKVNLVIVKDGERVVGVLSGFDLLWAVEPPYLKVDTAYPATYEVFWDGEFTERCRCLDDYLVGDYMRPAVVLNPDDTLMKASYLLDREKVDAALVMEDERLVGVVGTERIFSVIAGTVA